MDESTTKQCPECRGWLYAKGTRFSNRRVAEYLTDEVRSIIESTTEDSSKSDLQEALTTIEEICVKAFRQMEGLEKPEPRFLV